MRAGRPLVRDYLRQVMLHGPVVTSFLRQVKRKERRVTFHLRPVKQHQRQVGVEEWQKEHPPAGVTLHRSKLGGRCSQNSSAVNRLGSEKRSANKSTSLRIAYLTFALLRLTRKTVNGNRRHEHQRSLDKLGMTYWKYRCFSGHPELVEGSLPSDTRRVREYFVYILASKSGVLYIGVTNDLSRRLFEHRQKLVPGFTKKYNVNRLVYFESFSDVRDAIAREKQLKGWRREKKMALIEAGNPSWADLSAAWGNG